MGARLTKRDHERFLREAIRLSARSLSGGDGGPFGAVIVQDGRIIARGWNRVIGLNDPTAHAEVVVIREACRQLKRPHLSDCLLYASCEPCPLCLSAIYWARLRRVFHGGSRRDAARIGFQDAALYQELRLPRARRSIPIRSMLRAEARVVMEQWQRMEGHTLY